jgi:2-oxoisovalerate dehydrogenase E1 component alpha subunit
VEHRKKVDNPINRLRLFLEARKWWSDAEEEDLKARHKKSVMEAFKRAESLKRFELENLFNDVYGGEEPWNIVRCLRSRASS